VSLSAHSADKCIAESHAGTDCVDKCIAGSYASKDSCESKVEVPGNPGLGLSSITAQTYEFKKFWETEAAPKASGQITDVQGHLKQRLEFWQEVLQAPPPV